MQDAKGRGEAGLQNFIYWRWPKTPSKLAISEPLLSSGLKLSLERKQIPQD